MKQQEITDKAIARYTAVYYMRKQGMTYKAIAKRIGVSTGRAQQMLRGYEWRTKRMVEGLVHLRAYIKQLGEKDD